MATPETKAFASWALSKYPTAAAGVVGFALSMVRAEIARQVTKINMTAANNRAVSNTGSSSSLLFLNHEFEPSFLPPILLKRSAARVAGSDVRIRGSPVVPSATTSQTASARWGGYSPPHPTAVDNQYVAVDVIAGRCGKKYRRASDILRRPPSSGGDALKNLPAALRVGAKRGGIIRRHVAGSNCVDVHSFWRPFVGQCLGQLRDSTLGRRISRNEYTALERKQGRDVDDLSAPLGHHPPPRELAEPKNAVQVNLDDVVPVRERELHGRRAVNDSGVVDQNID